MWFTLAWPIHNVTILTYVEYNLTRSYDREIAIGWPLAKNISITAFRIDGLTL